MAYTSNEQLGQLQAAAALTSIGSSIARLFGGGKSKAQKQAESQQRRSARAGGVWQAVANALSRFPPEVEQKIMGMLQSLYTTGAGDLNDFRYAPRSVADAYLSAPYSGKKRAVAADQSYKSIVKSIYNQILPDEQWWTAYQSGGGPTPTPMPTPTQQPFAPSGGPPSYTPTPITFPAPTPIKEETITGFNPMWLAIGAIGLIVLMKDKRR